MSSWRRRPERKFSGRKIKEEATRDAEASPAGGGGWAGAREARTAAPHSGSLSAARSTEVTLTCLSWPMFRHASAETEPVDSESRLRLRGPELRQLAMCTPALGDGASIHSASCTAMRIAGGVRCVRRGCHGHGGNCVAAIGLGWSPGPAFVANMLWYIDLWGLGWTWLLPRAFELIGISDFSHVCLTCSQSANFRNFPPLRRVFGSTVHSLA